MKDDEDGDQVASNQ